MEPVDSALHAEGQPLIAAMPDGGRGRYTDSSVEPAGTFGTFILRDLDRTFRTRAERGGRVVEGLSTGGGAVKLALKFPEVFCAAASHSGALANPDERGGVVIT